MNARKSTDTFTYYNRNPKNKKRGADCVPRAISGATGITWEEAIRSLTETGIRENGVLNEKDVYATWLKENGWEKMPMPKKSNNRRYTVAEFQKLEPKGTFIISVAGHLTFIEDGMLYDTWNCQGKSVGNYWRKEVES